MLSILISIVTSFVLVGILTSTGVNRPTTIFFGIFSFIAAFYLVGFLVRKRVTKVQKELQEGMMVGQQRMNRKIQQFQNKPGGNLKLIQRQLEADQRVIYQEGLDFTKRLEPFKKWSLMMNRQIITMRMQFLYQLKEFDQVDKIIAAGGLFKGPMLLEPMAVAMKMARLYKNKDIEGVQKTFKRHIKWFRSDRGTLLYGVMTWVLVKEGKLEEARQLLVKAKEATGHPTFGSNWEKLSNDKPKNFSNAGLGEEWYGLYLETPPQPKQQRARRNAQQRGF